MDKLYRPKPQNIMREKSVYHLPHKNVIKESKLQKGKINLKHKSDLTDDIIQNTRYQMSNFYPILLPSQNNIDVRKLSSNRGGISTRLDKYK